MTTYFVPIENKRAPLPLRWFFHVVEATSPVEAMADASRTWLGRGRNVAVWAALRDCPTPAQMQELREDMDRVRFGRRGIVARVREVLAS